MDITVQIECPLQDILAHICQNADYRRFKGEAILSGLIFLLWKNNVDNCTIICPYLNVNSLKCYKGRELLLGPESLVNTAVMRLLIANPQLTFTQAQLESIYSFFVKQNLR